MAFVIAIIFAFIIAGTLGTKRKIGFGWSLAACLLLSPILGLIITLCSEKLPEGQESTEAGEEKPLSEVLSESNEQPSESSAEAPIADNPSTDDIKSEESTTIDY